LRTIYTLEDALNMFEVVMVRKSNEYLAQKEAERNAQRQK